MPVILRLKAKTGNLKLVMQTMGQIDVKTAMKYQHPELDIVRTALNETAPGARQAGAYPSRQKVTAYVAIVCVFRQERGTKKAPDSCFHCQCGCDLRPIHILDDGWRLGCNLAGCSRCRTNHFFEPAPI